MQVHIWKNISSSKAVSIVAAEGTIEAGEMEMVEVVAYNVCFYFGI